MASRDELMGEKGRAPSGLGLRSAWRRPPVPSLVDRTRLPYHGFPLQALFLGFLHPLPRGRRLLDVGCGAAFLARCLEGLGNRVVGVDASEPLVSWLVDDFGMDVRAYEVGRRSLTWDEPFDGIICFDVLEHCTGRKAFLEEIFSWCRPGGFVLLSVANYAGHGAGGFTSWAELAPYVTAGRTESLKVTFPPWFQWWQRLKLGLRRRAKVTEGDRFHENPGFRHLRRSPAAPLSCLLTSVLLAGMSLWGLKGMACESFDGPGSYLVLHQRGE